MSLLFLSKKYGVNTPYSYTLSYSPFPGYASIRF